MIRPIPGYNQRKGDMLGLYVLVCKVNKTANCLQYKVSLISETMHCLLYSSSMKEALTGIIIALWASFNPDDTTT